MTRILKAGILLLVLVVPAFVFLFLKLFGQNHFELPTFFPVVDVKTGEIQTRPGKESRWWKSENDTLFYHVPNAPGRQQNGRAITTDTFRGKIYVASFFNISCDSTCQKVAGQLGRVQDIFIKQPQVALVSYVDDLKLAAQLAGEYEAQTGKWFFFRPDTMKTATVGEYYYRIKQRPMTGRKNETFTLYEGLVLIDKEGRIRGFYNGVDRKDIDRLVLEIRVLLDVYAKQ